MDSPLAFGGSAEHHVRQQLVALIAKEVVVHGQQLQQIVQTQLAASPQDGNPQQTQDEAQQQQEAIMTATFVEVAANHCWSEIAAVRELAHDCAFPRSRRTAHEAGDDVIVWAFGDDGEDDGDEFDQDHHHHHHHQDRHSQQQQQQPDGFVLFNLDDDPMFERERQADALMRRRGFLNARHALFAAAGVRPEAREFEVWAEAHGGLETVLRANQSSPHTHNDNKNKSKNVSSDKNRNSGRTTTWLPEGIAALQHEIGHATSAGGGAATPSAAPPARSSTPLPPSAGAMTFSSSAMRLQHSNSRYANQFSISRRQPNQQQPQQVQQQQVEAFHSEQTALGPSLSMRGVHQQDECPVTLPELLDMVSAGEVVEFEHAPAIIARVPAAVMGRQLAAAEALRLLGLLFAEAGGNGRVTAATVSALDRVFVLITTHQRRLAQECTAAAAAQLMQCLGACLDRWEFLSSSMVEAEVAAVLLSTLLLSAPRARAFDELDPQALLVQRWAMHTRASMELREVFHSSFALRGTGTLRMATPTSSPHVAALANIVL